MTGGGAGTNSSSAPGDSAATSTADGAGTVPQVAGHPMPALLGEGTDPELVAWRERLPAHVEELLQRWELRASAPFVPGGSSAWVAPVTDRDGAERVLKVAWAHEEARDEAAGMRAWQGRGAAALYRSERVGDTSALLLERVRPGVPLAQLLTWPERDEVLVNVAMQLWKPPSELEDVGLEDAGFEDAGFADPQAERAAAKDVSEHASAPEACGFRPLAHMCAWWADRALEEGGGERAGLPREVVLRGLELFHTLPAGWDGEEVLLATDLHPSNVLAGGTGSARRWVLIDPKPYVGDPHYDLLQHMFNDPERLRTAPGPFAERMADLAGLDPVRLRRWLFARAVQEAGTMDAAAEAALLLTADAGL